MRIDELPHLIKSVYPYMKECDIDVMVDCGTDILLNTLYPFDEEKTEIPQRKVSWIYRCVLEQIERKGMTSVLSYRENGIQITFDKSQVSEGLLREILPYVGI